MCNLVSQIILIEWLLIIDKIDTLNNPHNKITNGNRGEQLCSCTLQLLLLSLIIFRSTMQGWERAIHTLSVQSQVLYRYSFLHTYNAKRDGHLFLSSTKYD